MYKTFFDGKKVVFFDLDGTLVDTDLLWMEAFFKVAKSAGDPLFDWDEWSGSSIKNRWKELLKRFRRQIPVTADQLTEQTNNEFIKLLTENELDTREGFWELVFELKTQKQIKIALTSNSSKKAVDAILKAVEINQTFDIILTSDDVNDPKPNPDMYIKGLKNFKISPSEALAFEDSIIGAQSAIATGIDTLVIWNNKTRKNDYPLEVKEFFVDFTPFPGNLDLTLEEHIKKAAQQMAEQRETLT